MYTHWFPRAATRATLLQRACCRKPHLLGEPMTVKFHAPPPIGPIWPIYLYNVIYIYIYIYIYIHDEFFI